jgi:hypothetical protein
LPARARRRLAESLLPPARADEHLVLASLVERDEALLLLNTEPLLKAAQPELFTQTGRLKRRSIKQNP